MGRDTSCLSVEPSFSRPVSTHSVSFIHPATQPFLLKQPAATVANAPNRSANH